MSSDIKQSAVVMGIMHRTKLMCGGKGAPISAAAFLAVVIDNLDNYSDKKEVMQTKELLEKALGNLRNARGELGKIINSEKPTVTDELYMNRRLLEVSLRRKNGEVELHDLVEAIIKRSNTSIKDLINREESQPKENDGSVICDNNNPKPNKEYVQNLINKSIKKNLTTMHDNINRGDEDVVPEEHKTNKTPRSANISNLIAEMKDMREKLAAEVVGQDNAINTFISGYFRSKLLPATEKDRKRPTTFLFAGPPGVGKTMLGEKIAELLDLPYKKVDMSGYYDSEVAVAEFAGMNPSFKASREGNVTGFVKKHPKCVILFDEIEKASLAVIHLFLQLLDAGTVNDLFEDEEVSFGDAIVIITTNAGKQLYSESDVMDFSNVPKKLIIKALQKDVNPQTGKPFFPEAICSRFAFGNVVMFNHIAAHNLRAIAKKQILKLVDRAKKELGIDVEISENVYTALLFSEGGVADARTISGKAETFFNDEVHELLRLARVEQNGRDADSIKKICIDVDLKNAPQNICDMFKPSGKLTALIMADEKDIRVREKEFHNFNFITAATKEQAAQALKKNDIQLIMLDITFDAEEFDGLNIEDIDSPARNFLKYLREHNEDIPIYLLENKKYIFSEEEYVSFAGKGIAGIIRIDDDVQVGADKIIESIHQQAKMTELAKANKLISYETVQKIYDRGVAEISLFDFNSITAVEAEDTENIMSAVSRPDVCFEDVIGAKSAKDDLMQYVEFLKNPKLYAGSDMNMPKGVLLYGPPGTGKTMMAKAMAAAANVTFISAEGNQFMKSLVGEGADEVHKIFRIARKYAPAILFVDEIDVIAKERGRLDTGAGTEGALTAFLTEMDGFAKNTKKPVFVLAATNYDAKPGTPKSLDQALMRRFDRRIFVDLPDKEDRIKYLNKIVEKKKSIKISADMIENIAVRSSGMSLADLESIVNHAFKTAVRYGKTEVSDELFEEAFEDYNNGEIKKWDDDQLLRAARHEAGHAFLCWKSGETPSYLTIVARGDHGGYMQHGDNEGKALYTKNELLARIRTALGGRAAELVYYGPEEGISTGASGDLGSATQLAQHMVCTYGMDENLGLAVMQDKVTDEARATINRILCEQMELAVDIIRENQRKIDGLVSRLMDKNHLTGKEIDTILKK